MKWFAFVALVFCCFPAISVAAPGELDLTFNGTGRAKFKFGQSNDGVRASALQPDGKIVVVGSISVGGPALDFGIARFNTDGTLDASFDSDGIVATDIDFNENAATAVAIQPDGKIVVAGFARASPAFSIDFAVVRYESTGSRDFTFGTAGIVTTPVGTSDDWPTSIAIQADDGKIVVGGYTATINGEDYAIIRYNADGSLDPTFDTDGIVITDIAGDDDRANAINLQTDGKIVASGHSNTGLDVFSLVRYNTNGSLDLTFDGDGIVTTPGTNLSNAALIQPDGKIVVAGGTTVARYNVDGSLDATFAGSGTAFVLFGGATNIHGAALQTDGSILLTGSNFDGARFESGVARLTDAGEVDPTFGTAGVVRTSIGEDQNTTYSVLFDADTNTILTVGDALSGISGDATVARYDEFGTLSAPFGTAGIATADFYPETAYTEAMAVQTDGKVIVVGSESRSLTGVPTSVVSVARMTTNGLPDPTFRGGGKFTILLDDRPSEARGVAIQPDGKIVVAGLTNIGGFGVARFDANGDNDFTFDGDGQALTSIPGLNSPRTVLIQPDGKILLAATFFSGTNTDFAVLRYNANGSLDTTFDGDGLAVVPAGDNNDNAYAMALQPDGRIVVGGLAGTNTSSFCCDFGFVRLTSTGSLDTTFDVDGRLAFGMGSFLAQVRSIAIQNDGKIVAAGYGDDDFAIVRLNPNGNLDQSFGTIGRVTTPVGFFVDRAESVLVQSDGKLLVGGWSSSFTDYDFAIARYNANGTLDNSFAPFGAGAWGTGGVALANFGGSDDYGAAMQFDPQGRVVIAGRAGSFFGVARFQNVIPTAANVSISGRVMTESGVGLNNASVYLTDGAGIMRTTRTSSFGHYRFDDIEAGQIVVIAVNSKRYQYQPQLVSVNGSLVDIDFVPVGANSKQ